MSTANEALLECCEHGIYYAVKLLLEHGADVNYKDGEPLCLACTSFKLPVIELLFEHGASIINHKDILTSLIDSRAHQSSTDDYHESTYTLMEIVEYLLDKGLDFNLCKGGSVGSLFNYAYINKRFLE